MGCCSSSSVIVPSGSSKTPKFMNCPKSGTKSLQVSSSTVLQHINKPWGERSNRLLDDAPYYFCSDPDCDVVYFSQTDLVFLKSDLRTVVGIKDQNNGDAMACYCFDVTLSEAENDSTLKQFVIDMTKRGLCACESQNPSGRCCLKDFPS